MYHIPHWFISGNIGRLCLTNVFSTDKSIGEFYYWFSEILHFILPFILLLFMNSVIIHTLHKRSRLHIGQGQNEAKNIKHKISERQIILMLLCVTFGFLILTTPVKILVFYMNFHSSNTPQYFAGLYLFYQAGEKTYYTNHGINFFLYVISGQKFKHDLTKLFKRGENKSSELTSGGTALSSVSGSNPS